MQFFYQNSFLEVEGASYLRVLKIEEKILQKNPQKIFKMCLLLLFTLAYLLEATIGDIKCIHRPFMAFSPVKNIFPPVNSPMFVCYTGMQYRYLAGAYLSQIK